MFERYYPELLKFLFVRLRDREAARDLAQETYARVLGFSMAKVGEVQAPRALLYSTARHLIADQVRRDRVRLHSGLDDCDQMAGPTDRQPEQLATRRQQLERLLDTVAELPPRCREAFVLHKLKGLTHAQVAKRMGITINAVEKHLIRALVVCRLNVDIDAETDID